jgi:glutamate-5-semialdehyde dehydrogenase
MRWRFRLPIERMHVERAREWATAARNASRTLGSAPREAKDRALLEMAALIESEGAALLEANAADLSAARDAGIAGAMLDRLALDPARLAGIARSLREVVELPDPVGEVTDRWTRPNGMDVSQVRIPLGVILVIYEARPNVTVDAAALCLKSGNAVILRGGREAIHSNAALAGLLARALESAGLPGDACVFVDDPDRDLMLALLQQEDLVDLAIPRGGEGLIRFVAENARVPVIKHYKGVCHLYVDRAADADMATALAHDGKVSRPGVCNALECLLVHEEVAAEVLPNIGARLGAAGVEFRADPRALALLRDSGARVAPATEEDWGREFLDLVLAVKVVPDVSDAIDHIRRHGSMHTEVVVTQDEATARRFQREVEASMVGWNVSTRFNDGGSLGLGAEMGISTTRLHAFGPMGVRELTIRKFVVEGRGQVRHP